MGDAVAADVQALRHQAHRVGGAVRQTTMLVRGLEAVQTELADVEGNRADLYNKSGLEARRRAVQRARGLTQFAECCWASNKVLHEDCQNLGLRAFRTNMNSAQNGTPLDVGLADSLGSSMSPCSIEVSCEVVASRLPMPSSGVVV